MHSRGVVYEGRGIDKTAAMGDIKIVKFMHRYMGQRCWDEGFRKAIQGNHFEVVQYIVENKMVPNDMFAIRSIPTGEEYKPMREYLLYMRSQETE